MNLRDLEEAAYCLEMIESSCKFELIMYDMSNEELFNFLKNNARIDFFYIEYSYIELGRDQEWFEQQCRDVNHDRLKIKREILLDWPNSTDTSIFTEEQLDALFKSELPVIHTKIIREKFILNFIKSYNPLKPYVLGIDVASGMGRDFSTITIVDPSDLEPVAYFYNNKIELPEFSDLIIEICNLYFPMSCIAIEYAPISINIIQLLLKNNIMKKKLVYTYTDDKTKEKEIDIRKNSSNSTKRKQYGIVTSRTTRPLMFDLLKYEVVNNPYIFRIKLLIKEIGTLEYSKTSGKIEHASGMHDDLLMSYLMARYALAYIPHINRFISIDDSRKANAMLQVSLMNNTNASVYKNFEAVATHPENRVGKNNWFKTILDMNRK